MFIPDPGSWFLPISDPGSRIPDPGSRIPDLGSRILDPKKPTKERGEKKFLFCSHKFHKIDNYFSFEMLKKKIWVNFQKKELFNFLPKKLSLSSQKFGFGIRNSRSGIRDSRSGIRKKPIPDAGSRGQKGTGSRIRIRNTEQQIVEKVLNRFYSIVCKGLDFNLKKNC